MNGIIDLSILQVLSAYIFIAVLMIILRVRGIAREKEVLISSIRMTLQLILVGYVLVYLFESMNPFLTLLVLLVMESFAIYNIIQRSKSPLSKELKNIVALSMVLGTLTSLLFFLFVVIQISPWYDPQYFIPIAGMLIGNSMTGISLGVNRLLDGMKDQKTLVEAALMLGATPKEAAKEVVDSAFDSAILPTINAMVGMGIVFLPGMMTGQILSGVSPVTAIAYQIAIMLGIVGSVSLTVILFVQLGYKSFFNDRAQLKTD